MSERSASKPSAVTRPAATSCHNASSTSAGMRLTAAGDFGEEGRAAIVDLRQHVARGLREAVVCVVVVARDEFFGVRAREER